MPWHHPTGNRPQVVTLLCLGPSQHDYISAHMDAIPDEQVAFTDETWTLNRGIWVHPHDLLFVMDNITGEAETYPEYGARLWNHSRPIITSDNCGGWPSHVHRYPFLEIQDWLVREIRPSHDDWWHNSVAYIVAYAGFIGVRELRVWGADYHHHRSGRVEDGHPNVAYWTGVMERAGLTVKPVSASTLLGANQRDYIYGYRDDPRPAAVARRARFAEITGGMQCQGSGGLRAAGGNGDSRS